MKILSLFNGISCGRLALERAGIKVDRYVSFEIDKYANDIAKYHFPNDEYFGDVTTADFTQFKGFDLIIGGSPCQNLSIAGNKQGLNGSESKLFFEYVRAIKEVNPKYFLLENNASMTTENKNIISEIMGVTPILINSNKVSAQDRRRLYWTNIPNIKQPKDKGLYLKDIADSIIENTEHITDLNILDLLEQIAQTYENKLEALFGEEIKRGKPTPVKYLGQKKIENACCPKCGFMLGARLDYQPNYCQQCSQKLKYYDDIEEETTNE